MELGIDYILEWLDFFQWLFDPARHFLYSATLGSLVWLLTLTISSAVGWTWEHVTGKRVSSGVVYSMIISCLLVGTSAALALHYYLDFGWSALDLPFNSLPMELELP